MSVLGPAPAAGAPPFWWAPGALVTRLLALALLALLLAGVGAAWIVSQAQQQQVLQRLAAQQEDEVQLLARLLASKVEQNQRVLVAVASGLTPALLHQPAALQAQVRQALASARWWDSLLLARADGVLLLHLRHGRTRQFEHARTRLVCRARLRGGKVVQRWPRSTGHALEHAAHGGRQFKGIQNGHT